MPDLPITTNVSMQDKRAVANKFQTSSRPANDQVSAIPDTIVRQLKYAQSLGELPPPLLPQYMVYVLEARNALLQSPRTLHQSVEILSEFVTAQMPELASWHNIESASERVKSDPYLRQAREASKESHERDVEQHYAQMKLEMALMLLLGDQSGDQERVEALEAALERLEVVRAAVEVEVETPTSQPRPQKRSKPAN